MKIVIAALGVLMALALGACSSENDGPAQGEQTATPGQTDPTTPVAPEADPAKAVVDQFYDALGKRDCFTMRTLAALSFQQDDDYWGDGCIDQLQEIVGDNYTYTIISGDSDGQESVFTVERPLPDGAEVSDRVVLINAAGSWAVESRTTDEG